MRPSPDSKMIIRTQSFEEVAAGMRQRARSLDRNEPLPSHHGISFENPDVMLAHFTPRRVKLLDTLARNGSMSVAKLAGSVSRAQAAVLRDLTLLQKLGAIELKGGSGFGEEKMASPLAAKYEIVYTLGLPSHGAAKRRLHKAS